MAVRLNLPFCNNTIPQLVPQPLWRHHDRSAMVGEQWHSGGDMKCTVVLLKIISFKHILLFNTPQFLDFHFSNITKYNTGAVTDANPVRGLYIVFNYRNIGYQMNLVYVEVVFGEFIYTEVMKASHFIYHIFEIHSTSI